MTTIRTTGDYLRLFGLAAALGVVGGLANELLHNIRGRNGNLRMPKYQKGPGLLYLGFFGPLILGAVAAVIVLVFLPLGQQTRVDTSGRTVIDRTYDPLRVVPLSLAAGVAGSAVLTAAQARLVALVNQQKAEFLEASVSGSLERTAAEASTQAGQAVAATMQQMKPRFQQLVAQAQAEVPPAFAAELERQGVSASDLERAGAAVPGGAVVVPSAASPASPASPSVSPSTDFDELFDSATAEAAQAVKTTITERAAAERDAILKAAQAFDVGPAL